jgi:SH3-like domain-containing protein
MTNLRAAPTLQSAIVVQLFPGAVVQVQHASADWWRARTKTPQGKLVEGYIREDRLNFK